MQIFQVGAQEGLVEKDLVAAGSRANLFEVVERVVVEPGEALGDFRPELSPDFGLGHRARCVPNEPMKRTFSSLMPALVSSDISHGTTA